MATDPRGALDRLVAALYAHLDAAEAAGGDPEADPVLDATVALADAFDTYDEALYDATGIDTPFYLDDDDEDEEDDDDEEDGDEDDDDGPADGPVDDDEDATEPGQALGRAVTSSSASRISSGSSRSSAASDPRS